jgi:branched-subunit amino acid permease
MNAGWKIFLLSLALFAIAFGAERLLVPDIVPIGFAEEPQSLLAVQTAFVLRAVELIAGSVAAISFVVTLGAWMRRRVGGSAQSLGAGTSIPSAE